LNAIRFSIKAQFGRKLPVGFLLEQLMMRQNSLRLVEELTKVATDSIGDDCAEGKTAMLLKLLRKLALKSNRVFLFLPCPALPAMVKSKQASGS
jgi:hypothetical protein